MYIFCNQEIPWPICWEILRPKHTDGESHIAWYRVFVKLGPVAHSFKMGKQNTGCGFRAI